MNERVKNRLKRIILVLIAVIIFGSSSSQSAFAAPGGIIGNLRDIMQKKVLVSTMQDCASHGYQDNVTGDQAKGGEFFGGAVLNANVINGVQVRAPLWLIRDANNTSLNLGGQVRCSDAFKVFAEKAQKNPEDIIKETYNCGNVTSGTPPTTTVRCQYDANKGGIKWGALMGWGSFPMNLDEGEWYLSNLDSFAEVCGAQISKTELDATKNGTGTLMNTVLTTFNAAGNVAEIDSKAASYTASKSANVKNQGNDNTCSKYAEALVSGTGANSVSFWKEWLKSKGIEVKEIDPSQRAAQTYGEGDGEKERTCMNSGGAKSLGWIVCPALEWAGDAAKSLYETFMKPALQVQPQLFTGGGNGGGVFVGWNSFREIANVLFIILLMVVIFSQLTGVGIDNYGIKKILPKLIVAAVMINLSYWLCVALVDVSNIVGNSIQGMFDGLGGALTSQGEIPYRIQGDDGTSAEGSIGLGGFVSATILGTGGAFIIAAATNPAILLTLGVSALGVIISILFTFLLLSVREAAIVVLTVVAPVAIACYMLPNTENLFKKWWSLFSKLLLVYPIVGFLVGGGNYVATLLLSLNRSSGGGVIEALDETFLTFTAMIMGIVPIFFTPMVLKSAFAAMGQIGGTLAGLGAMASKGAQSGIRKSEGYKNLQERGLERKRRIKAGYDRNKNETMIGAMKRRFAESRGGRLFGYDKSLANNRSAAGENIDKTNEARAKLIEDAAVTGTMNAQNEIQANGGSVRVASDTGEHNTISDARELNYDRRYQEAVASGNENRIKEAITAMNNSGLTKNQKAAITRRHSNIDLGDAARNANFSREFLAKQDFMAADMDQQIWNQNGGYAGTGRQLGVYGDQMSQGYAGLVGAGDLTDDISQMRTESAIGAFRANPTLLEDPAILDKKDLSAATRVLVYAQQNHHLDQATGMMSSDQIRDQLNQFLAGNGTRGNNIFVRLGVDRQRALTIP